MKEICIVTGANSGLGKNICLQLAAQNKHIVMVCRDSNKGQQVLKEIQDATGNESIDLLMADLSSVESIHALSDEIHKRYSAIQVLINNAGVVLTHKELSVDGIEMTLATNYLAPFLLTKLLLDLLKAGAPARIINISSHAHYLAKVDFNDLQFDIHPYKFFQVYANSKLLLNSMSFALAKQLNGTGITINCIHPGGVRTNLGKSKKNKLQNILVNLIMLFFISPQKAAAPVVNLALAPEYANTSGKYFSKWKKKEPSKESLDENFAKVLLQRTNELIGDQYFEGKN